MEFSKETKERLQCLKDDFMSAGKEVVENYGPLVLKGLGLWFGGAAILGALGTLVGDDLHRNQTSNINNVTYIPDSKSCVVVDPTRENVVTVKGYTNSRFTQVLRAAAPVIAMTEGKTVTLGTTPVYVPAPCATIREDVTHYESAYAAKAAEYANAQALTAKLEEARKTFNRTEGLIFTERAKAPQPQP
jgi:hypothetical protein